MQVVRSYAAAALAQSGSSGILEQDHDPVSKGIGVAWNQSAGIAVPLVRDSCAKRQREESIGRG